MLTLKFHRTETSITVDIHLLNLITLELKYNNVILLLMDITLRFTLFLYYLLIIIVLVRFFFVIKPWENNLKKERFLLAHSFRAHGWLPPLLWSVVRQNTAVRTCGKAAHIMAVRNQRETGRARNMCVFRTSPPPPWPTSSN
jgi:hypothetical protein